MKSKILERALSLAVLLAVTSSTLAAEPAYDLWIRNGTIADGTGRPQFQADVLVRGDTIVKVGKVDPQQVSARRVLDAEGRVVAPGFIDTHAHGDPLSQSFESFLGQGITTVVLGQDGATADGVPKPDAPLAEWLQAVARHGSEVNIATLSGHGTLRIAAGVGNAPYPTKTQMTAMLDRLRADMAAGSFGLSFGLEYAPGRFAHLAEEKALGDLVGREGGIVMSHMRSEDSDKIAAAIDELLKIDAHVHVSHIKIVSGKRVEEARAVLQQLEDARAHGRKVTADVYTYFASASDFVFLYPEWAKSKAAYEKAVATRRAELEAHIRKRVAERNGPQAILFVSGQYAGKRLSEVAQQLGKPYVKVMIDDIGYGGPEQAQFIMSPAVQEAFISADHINICTDGAPGSHHPRAYGTFSRVLEDYVGPAPKMSLERAIYKMSGLAADTMGIDRGVVAAGRKADLLVIAPKNVHNRATWTEPMQSPTGFDYVIVNGRVAQDHGKLVSRSGVVLRRGAAALSADGK